MNEYLVNQDDLVSVANAIRKKTLGNEALVFPDGFVEAIGGINGNGDSSTYMVTLQHQGYVPSDIQNSIILVDKNELLEEPTMVSDENQYAVLEGWYTGPHLMEKFDFNTRHIDSNITLYANWIECKEDPKIASVLFWDSNDPLGTLYYRQRVIVGYPVAKPLDPVSEFTSRPFFGWATRTKPTSLSDFWDFKNDMATVGGSVGFGLYAYFGLESDFPED